MAYIPEWFSKQLSDFGGRLSDGRPKLRVVFAPEHRWPSGVWKYPDPHTPSESMQCWVLETYAPPPFFGSREDWINNEMDNVLGCPYPNNGAYVIKSALLDGAGNPLKLDESTMRAIQWKHNKDMEWAESTPQEQADLIARQAAEQEKTAIEKADKEADDIFDHYYNHAHEMSTEDDRLIILPSKHEVITKGGKQTLNDKKRGSKSQKLTQKQRRTNNVRQY